MKQQYVHGLPEDFILEEIRDEGTLEIWVIFAYFSKSKIEILLKELEKKDKNCKVHISLSSSSINPLYSLIENINILNRSNIDFHLINQPLMHSKLFAVRKAEGIGIYIGSANLTVKAANANIETGVILEFNKKEEGFRISLKYLNEISEIVGRYSTDNSKEYLFIKSALSYIRYELIFLAFEKSKLRQALVYSPQRLRKLIFNRPQDDEESIVNIATRNTLSVFLLDDDERNVLLSSDRALIEEIQRNYAINLNSLGWVSSMWSLKNILSQDRNIKLVYNQLLENFKSIRNEYKNQKYRDDLSKKIKEHIFQLLQDYTVMDKEETEKEICEYLDRIKLPIQHPRSPYVKLECLYDDLIKGNDVLSLLNPYKLGDYDEGFSEYDISFMDADQINLIAMCELAIKLRSRTRTPKIPAVWWFDHCLDIEKILKIFGQQNHISGVAEYKNITRRSLEVLISKIENIDSEKSLDDCVKEFCGITGFNLVMKNPVVNKMMVYCNDISRLKEEEPYACLSKETVDVKIPTNGFDVLEIPEIMFVFDEEKFGIEENDMLDITGEFVFGKNLFLYHDPDEGEEIYFCVKDRKPT